MREKVMSLLCHGTGVDSGVPVSPPAAVLHVSQVPTNSLFVREWEAWEELEHPPERPTEGLLPTLPAIVQDLWRLEDTHGSSKLERYGGVCRANMRDVCMGMRGLWCVVLVDVHGFGGVAVCKQQVDVASGSIGSRYPIDSLVPQTTV